MPLVADEGDPRTISLGLPAKPDYLVLARLTLSGVCRLTSLGPEEVADLKLAITEAATGLLGAPRERRDHGAPLRLRFSFALADDRLVVDVHGSDDGGVADPERELGRALIAAAVDEAQHRPGAVRLVKFLVAAAD